MIELKNINADYGKTSVLSDLSLSIGKDRLLSVIGANGSGKSTLLKAILGIVEVSGGEIIVDGKKAEDMSRKELATKIAYLAQGKSVPDMTVGQMVLHGRFPHLSYPRRYSKKDREIAENALLQTDLSEHSEKPMPSLSGGMRQNAYIAMALAQDTDYILLDEPTSYLDIAHQLKLMKTLRSLADSGKGIAAVMHDLPLAFGFSDEIAVVKEGGIALWGSPEKICQSGIIKEIFGVELLHNDKEGYYYYKLSE